MSDIQNESNGPEQGGDSGGTVEVGERLRKAREEAGIDINEMAGRLRLTSSQLAAIEAGTLEQFGASIYARGYVANYARLLGLRVEPLLARLEVDREEPPLAAAAAVAPPGQRLAENVTRVATYAVGTVVLALPVLWWASEGSLDALFGEPTPPPTQQVVAASPEAEDAAGAHDETGTETGTERSPGRVALDEEPRKQDEKPLMASMGMPRSSREAEPESNAETAPEEEAAAEEAPADRLVLDMAGDSWVEIRDGAGERLEYDLLKKGTTREYTGRSPYRVLIGNADQVTVRYNDAPFDITPFVQGNLARFKVGEEPAGG